MSEFRAQVIDQMQVSIKCGKHLELFQLLLQVFLQLKLRIIGKTLCGFRGGQLT